MHGEPGKIEEEQEKADERRWQERTARPHPRRSLGFGNCHFHSVRKILREKWAEDKPKVANGQ